MDIDAYNTFVRQSPQGILYCHTWWLDAVAPDRYEILTVEKSGRIFAAWPLVWSNPSKKRLAVMPPLTQKLGILFGPSEGKYVERLSREIRLTETLLNQLPLKTRLRQRFHEEFTNWLPLYWNGFRQTTRYTYVLEDLSSMDSIWDGMRNTVRTEIRKARKNGVRVRETDDLDYLYEICGKTFSRQGKAVPYSLSLVQRIDDACRNNAGRKILIAEGSDGVAHSCGYLVYDDRCAAVIMSGGDPDMRSSGAGSLVHWNLIEFAGTVTKRFDFEGSMVRPIESFYRSFGARQVPYFNISGEKLDPATSTSGNLIRRARRRIAAMIAPFPRD